MNGSTIRLIIFAIIAIFMIAGPYYRHVLGGKNMVFRAWGMFAGSEGRYGVGSVDARFTQVLADGSEIAIDRFETLDFGGKKYTDLPRNTWLIREKFGGAMEVAKRLCKRLDKGSKIKVYARLATLSGWRAQYTGYVVNCNDITS
ncbi:MAG: hypothetical protein ACRESZ_16920 [Methylococcales bacterium]